MKDGQLADEVARQLEVMREGAVDIYGEDWPTWLDSASYARINAERMFTFYLDPRA